MRRIGIAATVLAVAAGSAAAQESPADFLKRLFQPPADAVTEAFRPRGKPTIKRPPAAPANTQLLDVPMPHLRPGDNQTAAVLGYAPLTEPPSVTEPPPAAKPPVTEPQPAPEVAALPADAPPPPPVKPPALTPPIPHPAPKLAALPTNPLAPPPPAAQNACRITLDHLRVDATMLAPISEDECGIATPVAVASLDNGAIDFSTKAIIGCDLAEALATWIEGTVQAKAQAILGAGVDGIRVVELVHLPHPRQPGG